MSRSQRTSILSGLGLVLAFVFGLIAVWQFIRKDVADMPEYRLRAERICIPTPPKWVGDGFVEETLRIAGLDADASLLDRRIPEKLAAAFSAHPWVDTVRSVTLDYPNGATVDLVYREPVALVESAGGSQGGPHPVDANGVLLRNDFLHDPVPEGYGDLLRIVSVKSTPPGAAGLAWNDPHVRAAAQLAGMLRDRSAELELARIEVQPLEGDAAPTFKLFTRKGTEIDWGPVGKNAAETNGAEDTKKNRLLELAEQYGSLDAIPQNRQPVRL